MTRHRLLRTAGGALLSAALGMLALSGSAAASAFPGANGPIVFQHGTATGAQLYLANPDGSNAHAITNPPSGSGDDSPRFSADGKWVVFTRSGFRSTSQFGSADHLMIMRADGSCLTDISQGLTNTALNDGDPSFSPDGTYVVFERFDTTQNIYLGLFRESVTLTCTSGSVAAGPPVQLTTGQDSRPTISPDGTRIAFVRASASDQSIYVGPAATPSTAQRVTNSGPDSTDDSPDFSPDGTKIVFARDASILVTNANGSGSPTVLLAQTSTAFNRSPAYSPDGTRIVFQRFVLGGSGPGGSPPYGLYTIPASGGTPTVVPGLGGSSSAANAQPDWGTPQAVATPVTYLKSGSFVVGDRSAATGRSVTFWGAQWWKANGLSGGSAPAAFKGFADFTSSNPPACGGTWTTRPGNSSKPPASIPQEMAVIVASHVQKSGSTISGTIAHIIVVKSAPGYAGNPGHPGTGTVTSVVC